jgi:hypothetical protein
MLTGEMDLHVLSYDSHYLLGLERVAIKSINPNASAFLTYG